MSEPTTAWWKDPVAWGDAVVLAGAFSAAVLSLLDLLGVVSLPWFDASTPKLRLVLVSILTLSLVLQLEMLPPNTDVFKRSPCTQESLRWPAGPVGSAGGHFPVAMKAFAPSRYTGDARGGVR